LPSHFPALLEADLRPDPLDQFQVWFDEATRLSPLAEAAALATASLDSAPSVRMVLIKGWDARGLVFYTNRESRKGAELAANPRVALLFHWPQLGRQVRLEGAVEAVSDSESDAYFASRPRESQLGAVVSNQSQPIGARAELDLKFARLREELVGKPVTRPSRWGGFRLSPDRYEFWQHREDRLHDRISYRRVSRGWQAERLQP